MRRQVRGSGRWIRSPGNLTPHRPTGNSEHRAPPPHQEQSPRCEDAGMASPGDRRTARAANLARRRELKQERIAFLHSQLSPGEQIEAANDRMIVRDTRLIVADRSRDGTHRGAESFRFRDLTGWNPGVKHDERPFLVLRHGVRTRNGDRARSPPPLVPLGERGRPSRVRRHRASLRTPTRSRPHRDRRAARQKRRAAGRPIVRRPPGTREQRADAKSYLSRKTWRDRLRWHRLR